MKATLSSLTWVSGCVDILVEWSRRGWDVWTEHRGAWPSVSCHMNNSEGMLGLNTNSIPEGAELGDMR